MRFLRRPGWAGGYTRGVDEISKRPIRASDIVCEDPQLSLAAKGLFALVGLLGQKCTLAEVGARTTDPPEFVAMVLDELQGAGYVSVTDQCVTVLPPGRFGVGLSMTR